MTPQESAFFAAMSRGKTSVEAAMTAYHLSSKDSARATASRLLRKYRGKRLPIAKPLDQPDIMDPADDWKVLEKCFICEGPMPAGATLEDTHCGAEDCAAAAAIFPKPDESSYAFLQLCKQIECRRQGLVYAKCPVQGCTTRSAYKPGEDPRCLHHRTHRA
jgi:hypothetical protein